MWAGERISLRSIEYAGRLIYVTFQEYSPALCARHTMHKNVSSIFFFTQNYASTSAQQSQQNALWDT